MKKLNIIHLGIGKVGKEVVRLIWKFKDKIKEDYSIDLKYCGLFNSQGGIFDAKGLKDKDLISFPQNSNREINEAISNVNKPFILIDTTASDETFPYLISALKNGGGVVSSNKRPLSYSQDKFDELHKLAQGKLFYETTVGAALPVISTLKDLLATGDGILEIKGCLSGTLGFLFSQLDNGKRFSEAVLKAKELGFTEPDPRDDLSGKDIGRKALILARMLGQKIEMSDIKLQALYPDSYNKYSVAEFMERIKNLDQGYKEKFKQALNKRNTLRYLAKVTQKSVSVSLTEVPRQSDVGNLKGPDNMIIFKTKRYFDRPMVIKGPGAGVEVTASGVFGDILTIVKMI